MIEYAPIVEYLASYSPKPGDFIFDYNGEISSPMLWWVAEEEGKLLAFYPDGEKRELKDLGLIVPNLFDLFGSHQPMWRKSVSKIWSCIENALKTGMLSEGQVCSKLQDEQGVPHNMTTFVIRAAIAAGLLDGVESQSGLRLKFSGLVKDVIGEQSYSLSLSEEFRSLQDRLEMLIGHAPTLGSYRETLLRSFIARHLPDKYHVASGFLLGKFYSPKRQLDIIIYDRSNYAPFFREGDLVVLPIHAVRAIIEVKTTLDAKALDGSIQLLDDTVRREITPLPIFKGVYAFKGGITARSIAKHISNYYNGADETPAGRIPRTLSRHFQAIDAVTICSKACVLIEPAKVGAARMFSCSKKGEDDPFTSAFLASLISFLDIPIGYKRGLIQGIRGSLPEWKDLGPIHDQSWERTGLFAGWEDISEIGQNKYLNEMRVWRQWSLMDS